MSVAPWRARIHRRANVWVRPLTRALAAIGVTPDAVTITGLVVSASAAVCLVGGAIRAAGVIWLAGSALDMLDGALARETGSVRRTGAFLDSTLDRASEGLILTAAVYHFSVEGLPLAAAAAAYSLAASFMVSYTRARAEGLGAECKSGLATRVERVILIGAGLVFEVLLAAIVLLAALATITAVQRIWRVRAELSRPAGRPSPPDFDPR